MPPKEKINKEQIIDKAFEMTRQCGYESITARKLAEALGCSTQPIFRIYENMDGLKKDIYIKTIHFFEEYMNNSSRQELPIFLSMGLSYVELAKNEKHLFKLLTMSDAFAIDNFRNLIGEGDHSFVIEGVSMGQNFTKERVNEIFMMIWIFTHGIASIVANNSVQFSEDELKELLIKAYQSFAFCKPKEVL